MSITASQVNELRQKSGAGMMDCKNALVESNGDMDAAIDHLRKKGQKVAAKRGDRDANEGQVIALTSEDGKKGIMVAVNCETDFVAKNEDFGKFVNTIAEIALNNAPSNIDELKGLNFNGGELNIGDKIIEQTGVIGEKIELSNYELVNAESVVAYNHPGNRVASMVGMNKDGMDEVGRDVAMQIAAMAPIALNKDGISEDVIQKEIEVGKDLAIQEGKPADLAEKIAMGRLNKFFKENTLMSQQFIKDNKLSVEQYIKQNDGDLEVTEFRRISLGD